ncbi:MAG: hypothetical protein OXE86_06820 [Alphaproteobacteria bacterium]|nr:hypothetical protein [Alphaproteobacteria bacterium]
MKTIAKGRAGAPELRRQIAEYILAPRPAVDLERLTEVLQAVRTAVLEAMVGTTAERLRHECRIDGPQARSGPVQATARRRRAGDHFLQGVAWGADTPGTHADRHT